MKLPEEKTLKLSEIALIAGIKEDDARALAKIYDALIPSRKIGRVRLYPPRAAEVLGDIAELSAHGFSPEEIASRIGKGKTGIQAVEKGDGSEKIRPTPEEIKPMRREPEQSRLSTVLSEHELAGLRETDALLATRIQNLTGRVGALEEECLHLRQELEERRVRISHAIATLQDQMEASDEWISYFDMRLEAILREKEAVHEHFSDWIRYFDGELDTLKKPWWKR